MEENKLFNELSVTQANQLGKRDTGREMLETMSYVEAKALLQPLFEAHIQFNYELEKKYRQIKRIVKKYHAPETFGYGFCIDSAWLLYGAKDDIQNKSQLNQLEIYWYWNESRKLGLSSPQSSSWQDNKSLIQPAKQMPIESLFKNPLKRSGSRLIGLCPFHHERTPSFTIFTNSNTFYCFGCNFKGDVIAFYQRIYGVSFWEAVKQLTVNF